jgi:hypothetical protein
VQTLPRFSEKLERAGVCDRLSSGADRREPARCNQRAHCGNQASGSVYAGEKYHHPASAGWQFQWQEGSLVERRHRREQPRRECKHWGKRELQQANDQQSVTYSRSERQTAIDEQYHGSDNGCLPCGVEEVDRQLFEQRHCPLFFSS